MVALMIEDRACGFVIHCVRSPGEDSAFPARSGRSSNASSGSAGLATPPCPLLCTPITLWTLIARLQPLLSPPVQTIRSPSQRQPCPPA